MSEAGLRILVVDDDKAMRTSLMDLLTAAGHEVEALPRADQVVAHLAQSLPDVILSDVRMPGMSGLELLAALPPEAPPLVLISAHGDIATAVQAMQDGAYSFVEKPYEPRRLLSILSHAGQQHRLHQKTERLKARLRNLSGLDKVFLGQSGATKALREEVLTASDSPASVLLVGETGTGKDVIAHALHDLGAQSGGPFVTFNCATLSPDGFEREMFGTEGGAAGKLARAEGGTLFLDEVCACPLSVQAMLLRVLEQREITPLGASQPRRLSFRVISATNEDPEAAVAAGTLRRDVLHRLDTVRIDLPTLRARRDDILMLFTHFVAEFARIYEIAPPAPDAEGLAILLGHDWPGNVRELRNVAERFVLMARRGHPSAAAALHADQMEVPDTLREAVAAFEREVIARALRAKEGRMDAVAEALGIGRRTLNEKIVKLGLDKEALLQGEGPAEIRRERVQRLADSFIGKTAKPVHSSTRHIKMSWEDIMNKVLGRAAMAALCVGFATEAMATEWNVSLWGKRRAFTENVEKIAELVAEKTGGEFTMNISYGGLSKNTENLDGISIGAFEMAQFCAGYHPDKNPSITVLELPFLGIDSLELERDVSMAIYNHPATVEDLARWNAKLLMPTPLPQYNLAGVGEAPQSIDDFAGLTVRATGGIGAAMSASGAVPTSMSATEVRQAMDSAVIRAAAFAPHAHMSFGTAEIATWWTTNLNPGAVNCPVVVNIDAYDMLTDAEREALDSSVEEAMDYYIDYYNDETMAKWDPLIEDNGIEQVTFSDEDLAAFKAAAATPAAEAWIAENTKRGLPAQELYDLVIETVAASK